MRRIAPLIAVALIMAAVLGWRWYAAEQEAKAARALATNAAQVISVSFAQARALKVYSGKGTSIARVSDINSFGLNITRTTTAPFTVDYFVDLTRLNRASYRWDATSRTMFVTLPDVTIAAPNIDQQRAQVSDAGLWVSREAGARLANKASVQFANGARAEAGKPQHIAAARRSAVDAVTALTTAPLAAAGITGVRVVARFPSDRTRDERWDTSRPLSDVFAGAD